MDYEQKYKEALERARISRLQLLDIGEEATEIEHIFPELADSKDEKIRKTLLEYAKHWKEGKNVWNSNEEFCNNVISWLEKQNQGIWLPHVVDRKTIEDYAYQCAYDLSNDWAKDSPTWKDVEIACKLGIRWCEEHQKPVELNLEDENSDDDWIRKELIKLLNKMTDGIVEIYTPVPLRQFVYWLEKQRR